MYIYTYDGGASCCDRYMYYVHMHVHIYIRWWSFLLETALVPHQQDYACNSRHAHIHIDIYGEIDIHEYSCRYEYI